MTPKIRYAILFLLSLLISIPNTHQAKLLKDSTKSKGMLVELPDQNGLLWEITGKGLKKPSYVYGTMHVSSKLAFHLGDSFYYALMASDMVALEQNLDTVIDDWVTERARNGYGNNYNYNPGISLNTFDIGRIERRDINRAISYDPYVLNGIMFRRDESAMDFQKETYLDLYIYRLGKKMGKRITGVEDYVEAKELVKKAQKGAIEDRKKQKRTDYYKFANFDFSDAYRKGNIKLIDSFERNTNGPNFMEYMLFVRNENMVRRMDSIMQLDISLFTGVGCAHLGAERGVLNLLVQQGYTIRPVQSMANRLSKISKKYEDMQYKLNYAAEMSPDSSFTCQLPGKWIQSSKGSTYDIFIYPELVNGYFYTVYKLKTNGTIFGDKPQDVLLRIDSSLYESVPGNIISQKPITVGGHQGYEVINKTTDGNYQRYYMIITPLEAYIFKLGGTKEYAISKEANKFFKSISFTQQRQNNFAQFTTQDQMLSFNFPAHAAKNKTIVYDSKFDATFSLFAYDEVTKTTYVAEQIRANGNLDDDTFELKLLLNSYSNTDNFFIDNYKLSKYKGYDRIDGTMHGTLDRKVETSIISFNDKIVMLSAVYQGERRVNENFFNSVNLKNAVYNDYITYYDSVAKYTVKVPEIPLEDAETAGMDDDYDDYNYYYDDDKKDEGDSTQGLQVVKTFVPNNGSEIIKLWFVTKDKYNSFDSLDALAISNLRDTNRSYFIVDSSVTVDKNNTIVSYTLGDTATEMVSFMKTIYSQGGIYYFYGDYNSKTGPSDFIKTFVNTFEIKDTVWSKSPFQSAFDTFYADYFGKDSMNRARLYKKLAGGYYYKNSILKDNDAPKLISFIQKFYIDEGYVKSKANLIEQLGKLEHKSIVPALKNLYVAAGDTTTYKMAILNAMCRQKTKESYQFVKEKLIDDLPIGSSDLNNLFSYRLSDSLQLASVMFPEILDLTIVDEIKYEPYLLLGELLDSSFIKPSVYKSYLNRIYMDAYINLKRKLVKEETKNDKDLGIVKDEEGEMVDDWGSDDNGGYGNNYGSQYLSIARLLLPFKNDNPKYAQIFTDMHKLKDVGDRFELLKFCVNHNLSYPDSMIDYYAGSKEYRTSLYNYLVTAKKINLFPSKYLSYDTIIYAVVHAKYNNYYNTIEDLKQIDSFYTTKGKEKTKTLVYKIKRSSKDFDELLFVSNIPNDSFEKTYKLQLKVLSQLDPKYDEQEVISKEIEQQKLLANRPNQFYYKNYNSDYEEEDYGYDDY